MRTFAFFWFLLLTVSGISCQRSSPLVEQKTQPFLKVGQYPGNVNETDCELINWDIEGKALTELTFQLSVIANGKVEVLQKETCSWNQCIPGPKEITGRLHLVMREGDPFGLKKKISPTFILNLGPLEPGTRVREHSTKILDATNRGATHILRVVTGMASTQPRIFGAYFGDFLGPYPSDCTLEELKKNMINGLSYLELTVDYK